MLEKWIKAWGQMRRFEMIRIQMRKVVVQKETDEMMMNVKMLRSMRRRCRKRSSCETGNCVRVLKFLKKLLVQRRTKTKRRWAFRALELEPKKKFLLREMLYFEKMFKYSQDGDSTASSMSISERRSRS